MTVAAVPAASKRPPVTGYEAGAWGKAERRVPFVWVAATPWMRLSGSAQLERRT